MDEDEEVISVMGLMLLKLIKMDKWGHAHTALRNLTRGLPSRYLLMPRGKRIIKEALKELNNRRFLLAKPSTGEIHVSLNSAMAKEIDEFLLKAKKLLGE